jgi:uncharacterized protein YggE
MIARAYRGFPMRTFTQALAVAVLLATAAIMMARPGMAADSDKAERFVSVSATGSVSAVPDTAYITAGVLTEADAARDALNRNNVATAKLIDGLKAAGIAAKDIQTSQLNVSPRYAQPKEGRPATVSGYTVSNQVRITVRDVKRLGEILDQAISLGANQMHGIAFEVSTAESLKDDARKAAMQNARRRAELYATAAGAQLGPVLRISEEVRDAGGPMLQKSRVALGAVPVEAGTQTLEVEVHVTYALQ